MLSCRVNATPVSGDILSLHPICIIKCRLTLNKVLCTKLRNVRLAEQKFYLEIVQRQKTKDKTLIKRRDVCGRNIRLVSAFADRTVLSPECLEADRALREQNSAVRVFADKTLRLSR